MGIFVKPREHTCASYLHWAQPFNLNFVMADQDERFDGILLNIAQQAGSVDNILDAFFGFLNRKTDFFTGAQDESAAEQMVGKYYKKHWKAGQKKRDEQKE